MSCTRKCVYIAAEKLVQSKTSGDQHTFGGLTHEKKKNAKCKTFNVSEIKWGLETHLIHFSLEPFIQ